LFDSGDKGKGKKDEDAKDGAQRAERTVDEIIASLRSQSRTGQYVKSFFELFSV
jgi:hypothetical protein